MDHHHLGRTGLLVSSVALGTMNFGPVTPEADALEVLPACRAYGIGLLLYSPLNSGLLAGILGKRETAARSVSGRAETGLATRRESIEKFEAFCAEFGAPPAVVAQAWLCAQDGVASVIVGARTAAHLDDGIAAASTVLPPDALAALEAIFPGPGPAPETYAW